VVYNRKAKSETDIFEKKQGVSKENCKRKTNRDKETYIFIRERN
jgi:hypothetical protein